MTTYLSSSRVSRRDLLKAGFLGGIGSVLPGSVLPVSWIDQSWAAASNTSAKWFRVTQIDRTTVKVPYREAPARNMARELPHWQWTEVLEVELAGGQRGFGETLLYYTWGTTDDQDIERALGKNAVEIMWDDSLGAGLQIALFDAVARTAGVPVYALLGAKVHDQTPLAWWNIDTTVGDMALECAEAHKQGYLAYKTKGRPWFDVWAQVDAAAKAVPESFHLAIDFNDTLLDAERGIPILKELEKHPQVDIWETPIFQNDIEGNQAIRDQCRGKVAMHYGNPEPFVAIKEDVCDGFVVGRGATELMQAGTVAALANKPFWLQLVGTGITAAWSLHFGAALSHATWPAVNCHQLYQHTLLTQPIEVKAGFAKVPDRPGLGFELDRHTIENLRVEKPKSRPDPRRLVETTWQDGRRMYFNHRGGVNFVLNSARRGVVPYFERGVDSRLLSDDGSEEWKQLYELSRDAPHLMPAE